MTRPLKRHVEMESLFGADFLPISKKGRAAASAPAPVAKSAPAPAATAPKKGTSPIRSEEL